MSVTSKLSSDIVSSVLLSSRSSLSFRNYLGTWSVGVTVAKIFYSLACDFPSGSVAFFITCVIMFSSVSS